MKKNILTVVIMAATVINLILTIVVVFSVVPAMNKTNTLITKIATIVDLEIDSSNSEQAEYSMEDLEPADIAFTSKQTINLTADAGDTKAHYAMIEGVTVSYNTKAEDYDSIKTQVTASPVYIQDIVKDVIGESTVTTISEKAVREEAVKRIQELYKSKAIVDISLTGFMFS